MLAAKFAILQLSFEPSSGANFAESAAERVLRAEQSRRNGTVSRTPSKRARPSRG
jgi:hypothetical protein